MSTKIYDAYICPKFKGIEDMHKKIMSIRPIIKEELVKRYHAIIANEWTEYIDNCTISRKKIKKTFSDVVGDARKQFRAIKSTQERNVEYDFYFKIMLMPYKNNVYLKVFCEHTHSDLFKHLEKIGCKDFHYQNQTDRPDDVSAKEWNKRCDTWDAIFAKTSTWVDIGFEFNFSASPIYDIPLSIEQLKCCLPTMEKRAKKVAEAKLWDLHFNKKFKSKKPNAQDVSRESYRFKDIFNTEKGKKMLAKKTEKIKIKLIQNIVSEKV